MQHEPHKEDDLSQLRSEFAANVSHELRTPLTTIKGFADILASGVVTDEEDRQRFITMISVEADRMITLINDILHLYGRYIIGRMGLPYRQKNINIICVAVDAPQDVISAMAGKLGRVRGANIKTTYSNFTSTEPEIKTE